ncbi:nitroreductase family protein [uncultured Parabacteroides sp.]|jgi:nitroreductase|uniref:nitroreductase family protein n=1 Tax=uncultured Parabacteroides sp. TaxID=512312 RepID=UPI0025D2EA7F|nr:nitroreductase family protein [uncultured Parabacteroides sp.]
MKWKYSFIVLLSALVACNGTETQESGDSNQTLETIFNRKSVRKYTERPVEKEKLETLVRAGMAAPSSRDRRPWEFVIVTDRDLLDKMGDGLPLARMLKETKQAIIVCGDTVKSGNAWQLDCSAAAQNILLAAESMGLGAVWTAAYPYPERIKIIRDALQLPEHILPLTVIPLGYPTGSEKPKDKYNKKQIHYNGW